MLKSKQNAPIQPALANKIQQLTGSRTTTESVNGPFFK